MNMKYEANDVTKKKGLEDFYLNLLTNNVAFGTARSTEDVNQAEDDDDILKRIEAQVRQENEEIEAQSKQEVIPDDSESKTGGKRKREGQEENNATETPTPSISTGTKKEPKKEPTPEERKAKFAKTSTASTIQAARERYLQRKAASLQKK
eukprot:TRINITY_DN10319_c0_g1_i1.p1 TRINITY_DN10319_c0_g1~~TRINITY_DN10319_c0_g1_i1.p1  ORF type:complete len:151 (-),score=36.80 TRINITY_DN10319_c0_g1_i1:115-567(-)